MALDSDFKQFVALKSPQNRSKFQVCFKSSFHVVASKTNDRCISKKPKIQQNAWTVVQKSTLRISELLIKYHLQSVRIWYQNLSIVNHISIPIACLKQASSCYTILDPKVFQNVSQKDPKMLGRNWRKRPWDPFGHIKQDFWSQRHLPSPSRSSF